MVTEKEYNNAHGKLWYAIRSKKIDKQKVKCERCGSTKGLQYHHEDYDKPYKTMVLCSSCHRKKHKAEKNFHKAYIKEKRNKYGRFGDEKPIAIIKCLNCGRRTEKNNPTQKYCFKCTAKYNYGHYSVRKLNKLMKTKNGSKRNSRTNDVMSKHNRSRSNKIR